MLEAKRKEKLKQRRKSIIDKLKKHNVLPYDINKMNDEQEQIFNNIWLFDFSYWDDFKSKKNLSDNDIDFNTESTQSSIDLGKKRNRVRTYFRKYNVLPAYGELMTDGQKLLDAQIANNDFSYFEEHKAENQPHPKPKDIKTPRQYTIKTLEDRVLSDKRSNIREYFRKHNVLPAYGELMNEDQQRIFDQVENNDFSYFEEYKIMVKSNVIKNLKDGTYNKPNNIITATSEPKAVFYRLRILQILPPIGIEPTNEQQDIINDIYKNWQGKNKSFFIKKYLHLSTPESRLLYRAHKSRNEYGYNFNLTLEDIHIPEFCPLLNIKLSTNPDDKDKDNYYTIDRIDSSKGYVKGNVQVISLKANRMKGRTTEIELLKFATNALKFLKDAE